MPQPCRSALAAALVLSLAAVACKQAPPPEPPKAKRKSFSDSGWQPSAPAPAAGSSAETSRIDAEKQAAQQSWDQAHQATTDAERQKAAGQALEHTQQMAEPASAPPPAP